MHSLIALGASHLTRVSPQNDYTTAAIVHRGKAIQGLNAALATGAKGYGEADALLAAAYALTFQASYMSDGMADFITMVRGCALITMQIHADKQRTAFNLDHDIYFKIMEPRLENLPTLDQALLNPAVLSVEALRPLLRTTMDHHFHAAMLSVLYALQQSSKAGYMNFARLYGTFFDMSHEQFAVFVEPSNTPSQLLMAHFLALQLLLVPLAVCGLEKMPEASKARTALGSVEWAEKIFEKTPVEMKVHMRWPMEVMAIVRREVEAATSGRYGELEVSGRILRPYWAGES
jgi:hypothetical protein